jgi:hypothetical protein
MTTGISWGAFAEQESELARFGVARLTAAPAYLATVRRDGRPRVHPVTPVFTTDALYLFMEPTSPKGRDLRERGSYAIHNGVPDNNGTLGELFLNGEAFAVEDAAVRARAASAAKYDPAGRYILFELTVAEVRCNGYGDVELPEHQRWTVNG